MTGVDWLQKVYRLRKLPNWISSHEEVAQIVSKALRIAPEDVVIYSLARTSDKWENPPSKVGTLQLRALPELLRGDPKLDEWEVLISQQNGDKLILDTHFRGLTVLNDVEPIKHHSDCIAISGLASHPFGSWQPHGPDKSYMWIRDELPKAVPGVRAIIYGYDSPLIGSTSFQSISDIALGFVHQLGSGGWNLASSKPIVFLAHSLGGLVLKEALIQIADRNASNILSTLRGAIMFGVPSLGMQQSHLLAMVKGQANDILVQDLSRENGVNYLRQLNKSFDGISFTRTARIFWAYETKESHTVVKLDDGSWSKKGPRAVLVNPDSATGYRNHHSKDKFFTVPINEDHTNMVKFSRGDNNLGTVISLLTELCGLNHYPFPAGFPARVDNDHLIQSTVPTNSGTEAPTTPANSGISQDEKILEELDYLCSSLQGTFQPIKKDSAVDIKSNIDPGLQNDIDSIELDFRLRQIGDAFQGTFNWIFELPFFCEWLQEGSGLFWIYGKPGCGKSTLMKFILNSKQTWELLHNWTISSYEIIAGFFFHYRGTALQKSFEGVLRSLIIQIFSPHYRSFKSQHQSTWDQYRQLKETREDVIRLEGTKHTLEIKQAAIRSHSRKVEHRLVIARKDPKEKTSPEELELKASDIPKLEKELKELKNEYKVTLGKQECVKMELYDALEKLEDEEKQIPSMAQRFKPYMDVPETKFMAQIVDDFHDDSHGLIAKLERMLRRLLDQNVASMDVMLFFDALDEFDGHLDMISRFLKGLVNLSPTSKTRVKVCLSSRPWKKLHTQFSSHPNFALHDYTKDDIKQYTFLSLAASPIAESSTKNLIPSLITRANGVFLWVKLAVRELSITSSAPEQSLSELEETLQKLPTDLQDFYDVVIERIGQTYRRQTYVLFELLTRQRDIDPQITAAQLSSAVLISGCATIKEAQHEFALDKQSTDYATQKQKSDRLKDDILTWSGGLVEVHGEYPQFMHQTVLEFFATLSLKRKVLGDLAPFFTENGHSYHLKYWIFEQVCGHYPGSRGDHSHEISRLGYHTEQSELTTGNSHLEYIDSVSDVTLLRLVRVKNALRATNAKLSFMVSHGLTLGLNEWAKDNPSILRTIDSRLAYCPVLQTLIFQPPNGIFHERYFTTACVLLENEMSLKQDRTFFATVLNNIWNPNTGPSVQIPSTILHKLAALVLKYGQDPNIRFILCDSNLECTPLHLAPPEICTELIGRGAAVNAPDANGRTPLDWVLALPCEVAANCTIEMNCSWRYEKCRILINSGATLSSHNSITSLYAALEEFGKAGYEIQTLWDRVTAMQSDSWRTTILRFFAFNGKQG